MSLTAIERETVCVCNDETNEWEVYSCSPKTITKIKKAGLELLRVDADGGHYFKGDYGQVSFRAKSNGRNWTPEQRQAAADRMRAIATKNT
ncbi:hypothetical protein IAQ67_16270 [Paenibacillus peoriae]|uniref:Uncharacterized protein n=1 Tax=Paenibacillus peoriae TaxID=59893 RepID=A0A7H0Y2Z0_9BACL|nr:hypothetical protein [Paenibacillus peoriae]QNR65448.1 hypothetical protein IAQ67_16270 [Paenibacillus peoriae]